MYVSYIRKENKLTIIKHYRQLKQSQKLSRIYKLSSNKHNFLYISLKNLHTFTPLKSEAIREMTNKLAPIILSIYPIAITNSTALLA